MIQSQVLREARQYLVHLPASYDNDPFYIKKGIRYYFF
jgi:hypothetical protein